MTKLSLLQSQISTCMASVACRHKVVVIMGPTGCGKSTLSVDLASRFFPSAEILNSDKIQLYRGLDVTTNKIPPPDRRRIPHHLLGVFDSHHELTSSDYRSAAAAVVATILSRRRLPFVVGGSNSFIYALLAERFNPDVFGGLGPRPEPEPDPALCREVRYDCCFIWVDVSPPELNRHLVNRVDRMIGSGMLDELADYFSSSPSRSGLYKAIGVQEFEKYFSRFPKGSDGGGGSTVDDVARREAYDESVQAIKDNTCRLAKTQRGKILRLRDAAGWNIKRVDATAAVAGSGRRATEMWERQVLEPSVEIIRKFLIG